MLLIKIYLIGKLACNNFLFLNLNLSQSEKYKLRVNNMKNLKKQQQRQLFWIQYSWKEY